MSRNASSSGYANNSSNDDPNSRRRAFFNLMMQYDQLDDPVPRNRPCRNSALQGRQYIVELLGSDVRCFESFRMEPYVFRNLCDTLRLRCGITDTSRGITVEEQVERFQHSKETHCIGAIDGTHVATCVPQANRVPYRDRNAEISQNVLAACSHDMMFTYVMTGWKGSAHDSRIFSEAASVEGFPTPRGQQYYVVDAGFPNIPGYLAPYKGERLFLEYGDAWMDYDEFRNPPLQEGNRVDIDMSSVEMNAVRDRIPNQLWRTER
ncbi:hypothetical protein CRG98_014885 [Punica granatum]|uniref:Uncharacterized protein n=1 Tax=Punica granatum TaxID=22663 RepID=A0A2I0K9J0_PUNGR|nr:hypothetical protein CRG98_014885 [Punica granatum]